MSGYLLDTNVLSEVLKLRPSEKVLAKLRVQPAATLFTSSICVMELRFGAARHRNGVVLWRRIVSEVLPLVRILAVGSEEAIRAGEVLASLASRGERIGIEDVLIGATAQTHELAIATRNERHLSRVPGLVVENWWR